VNEIELSYVSIRFEAPIVYYKYKEGAILGFPEIKELIICAERLSGGKPYVTFADVTEDIDIKIEGKRYVADMNNMPLFRGTAALVKNSMYLVGANFLSLYNKPKYPFRAFIDREKAIGWLLTLPLE